MSTHWRAAVHKVNNAMHVLSYMQGEDLAGESDVPNHVQVRPVPGGFYLMRMRGDGKCMFDTWHMTLVEAKSQAEHEYGIGDDDWTEVAD